MGCDGSELWPGKGKLVSELAKMIVANTIAQQKSMVQRAISSLIGVRATSAIYADRGMIADQLTARIHLAKSIRNQLVDVIRKARKCYAGLLGTMRAGHKKGHADQFEKPMPFPNRMAEAAQWCPPSVDERVAKPWLLNAPRMIFISDMGDALSKDVKFEYLKSEIIDVVGSPAGRSHLWLWLSKRPAKMAAFGKRLSRQAVPWPENLVAMTSVTSPATANRVAELRRVPSPFKALSCEPAFSALTLDLTGIDWVIMGGGSDVQADPFQVEWALNMRKQCRQAGISFFLKQLGRNAMFKGQALDLVDKHGGDWTEWESNWRTREIPKAFRSPGTFIQTTSGTSLPSGANKI